MHDEGDLDMHVLDHPEHLLVSSHDMQDERAGVMYRDFQKLGEERRWTAGPSGIEPDLADKRIWILRKHGLQRLDVLLMRLQDSIRPVGV